LASINQVSNKAPLGLVASGIECRMIALARRFWMKGRTRSGWHKQTENLLPITHLLEERCMGTLQTGPHTPSSESRLSDIPGSIYHRVINKAIMRRGEPQTRYASRKFRVYCQNRTSSDSPSRNQVVSVAICTEWRYVGRQASSDDRHLFF
jgi:hypothetical protein